MRLYWALVVVIILNKWQSVLGFTLSFWLEIQYTMRSIFIKVEKKKINAQMHLSDFIHEIDTQ